MNVVFLHPDLRLGGSERLIVDAASELRARGHRVVLLTAGHDPARAFPETVDGSLDVRVRGRHLPSQIAGRLRAPCNIARTAWLGAALRRLDVRPDVVVCDLVAHAIPLVRRRARAPVIFYCHYPDRLLAPRKRGVWHGYRLPIDRLEAIGMERADRVLVNSRFTGRRLREAFPRIAVEPIVVHPGVEASACPDLEEEPKPGPLTILGVCRFEPRKNLALAVEAFAGLREQLSPAFFARTRLVLAGGFEPSLLEQRQTLAALEERARALRVDAQIEFRLSPSEAERQQLLAGCRVVVHTPRDEHFGYVPLEAMAAGRPVVAVNEGGPIETVRDGETGLLCPPHPAAFATALARLLGDGALAARLGRAGRSHAAANFSRAAFGRQLEDILRALAEEPCPPR